MRDSKRGIAIRDHRVELGGLPPLFFLGRRLRSATRNSCSNVGNFYMSHQDPIKNGFMGLVFGLLLMAVGGYFLQENIRLKIWGKPADAVIERLRNNTSSRGGSSKQVTFRFKAADGKTHKAYDRVSMRSALSKGDKIRIVYLPSKPDVAKLATNLVLGMWFGCVAAGIALIAYGLFSFSKEPAY